ncbi:TRAP transporter substrate-binding protein [Litorilituus lipolyticus]|uniref:ABC transporter substrate-binding protein n=1 Tax=Litorilituus lipolyticus TaxID=2491017 RepID=A0A502KV69_9GAMM|nr:TRAP transporter substrate-binding protein [Litorilituus lipolyticus]TPH15610.1 ABC transporter substrate-binding protein [Litorilituus lipolyticus]
MKKSIFLKAAIVLSLGISVLGFTGLAQADSGKKVRWKLAETWGPNFPIFGEATKNMANMVKEMSNGRFIIRIDSSNKHKSPLGIFDFVKTGQYQMGHSGSYYWKGKNFNTLFFTTTPFGMTAPEQYAWFYYGGGMELMKKVYDQYGILSFPGGNTGNQMGGWFKKEINSVEDFKGLKMRIPGFAGEVLARLGAKPTNIPSGELYTALERNTIDALEWVGPSLDLRMGFHKIAPYYYTGWHEPAAELQFMVNEKAYNALPKDLQKILTVAMKAAAYDMYAQSYHESAMNLATLEQDYPNVKMRSFPKSVMNAISQTNQDLLKEFAAKDPMTAEILKSLSDYQKKARAWTNLSDRAYLDSFDSEGKLSTK